MPLRSSIVARLIHRAHQQGALILSQKGPSLLKNAGGVVTAVQLRWRPQVSTGREQGSPSARVGVPSPSDGAIV
jgi:hypothetical protein